MQAHAEDFHAARFGEPTFVERHGDGVQRCSYCGSLSIEEALRHFQAPGTHYSGSDWKYGWPHKFYLGERGKFYAEHLKDATPEQIAEWNRVVAPLVGIAYDVHEGRGLVFFACGRGFQTWGDVGAVRATTEEIEAERAARAEELRTTGRWTPPQSDHRFGPVVPEWFTAKLVAHDYRVPTPAE